MGRIPRRAFIEGHDDISPELLLDLHRFLRSEEVLRSVPMRSEHHSILRDLDQALSAFESGRSAHPQRKDLKTSAIRQNGKIDRHEIVQSSEFLNEILPRLQIEMVSVCKDDL